MSSPSVSSASVSSASVMIAAAVAVAAVVAAEVAAILTQQSHTQSLLHSPLQECAHPNPYLYQTAPRRALRACLTPLLQLCFSRGR